MNKKLTAFEQFQERLRKNDIKGASAGAIASAVKAANPKNTTNSKTLDSPAGSKASELARRRKATEDHPKIFKNASADNPPRGYSPAEWKDYRKRHYGK